MKLALSILLILLAMTVASCARADCPCQAETCPCPAGTCPGECLVTVTFQAGAPAAKPMPPGRGPMSRVVVQTAEPPRARLGLPILRASVIRTRTVVRIAAYNVTHPFGGRFRYCR